ncbi:F-box/LRR-repeat protein [Actinidia chinensis var. chinensis]|uniref:F-box/LRR-repeat protein n=1 Tax=Actinidia chinensis var. chinensis TaxID=1590841 RepID=A0A2R6RAY2_ACTCC|nr:F-box/LRR-repeat protein [Actinidia chinensis var. chinensis]
MSTRRRNRRRRNYFIDSDSDSDSDSGHRHAADRISDLPDSILVHILSLLPIEDAIKTDVLSKRWQFLWTHVPSLLFRHRRPYRNGGDIDETSDDINEVSDFVAFVDKTLVLCSGSEVKKFGVCFGFEWEFTSRVNSWTRFAVKNEVEELHLELPVPVIHWDYGNSYLLPQLMYTNSRFRELNFSYCRVMPKGAVRWNSLKKLSIGYAKLSDDVIRRILEGCPVLEILEFHHYEGFSHLHIGNASLKKLILREFWGDEDEGDGEDESRLEIWAPYLQSLEILGCLGRNFRLMNVSSLVDVTLNCHIVTCEDDSDDVYERIQNVFRGFLVSLVHVKSLTLGIWALQVLSIMEEKGLSCPLLKCERLTLDTLLDKSEVPGIACMFESSPNLETLDINLSSSCVSECFWEIRDELFNFDEEHYWTSRKRTFRCLTLHLKKVTFTRLGGYSYDSNFPLVQFLLKNARVLQKMVINMAGETSKPPEEFFQAAQKLLSFPRCSPDAVVMFYK